MDIFIKSFNRPYFLDRCIESIYQNISGFSRIIVLDDGTPQKYLDRLTEKYSEITIRKSEFYNDKAAMISSGIIRKELLKFPGDFWYRECSTVQDFFMLLEDDMFVTEKVNLAEIEAFMNSNDLQIFKMLWLGSPLMNPGRIVSFGNYELLFPPKNISINHFQHVISNKFKKISVLQRLGLYNKYFKKNILPYYSIYIVAGAVYKGRYFDYMWKGVKKLDENKQIISTLKYYEDNNIELKVGKSHKELIKTSFKTSATNEFPNVNLSIFEFNKILNEAWLNGKLTFEDPRYFDVSDEQIKNLVSEQQYHSWLKWREEFTKGYKNLECVVD